MPIFRTWLDRVIEQPASMFATPAQVLRDERLDEAGVRAVLKAWERDARRLGDACAPGASLSDVLMAQKEFDRRTLVSSGA